MKFVSFALPIDGGRRSGRPRFSRQWLLAFLAVVGIEAAAAQLSNPGFENDLTDWAPKWDYGMSSALPEAARTGSGGLRITDDKADKGSGLESLGVEAEAGKKYEVAFWLKTVTGEGGVSVSIRFFDEAGKPIQKKSPTVTAGPSSEWKRYTVAGTAPERSVGFVVVVHSVAAGITTVDLDDFEAREAP